MKRYEVTVTDCEVIIGPDGNQLSEEEVRAQDGRYWTKTYPVEATSRDEAIKKACQLIENEAWSFTWEDTTFLPRKIQDQLSEEPELVTLIDTSAFDDLYC